MWVQFLQEAQEVTKSCVPFSDRVTFLGSMETRFLSFFPSEMLLAKVIPAREVPVAKSSQ